MQIPAAENDVKQGKRPDRKEPQCVKGRVLVMDDDEYIRSILRSMLRDLGYCASITRKGDTAIKKFQEAKELQQPFDVVILDMVIPGGMGGDEVFEKLRAMDPGIKAVLLTGDISHQALAHYTENGFQTVLLKPFMRDELIQALEGTITG
jgi:CheY-like chemotaxis protein